MLHHMLEEVFKLNVLKSVLYDIVYPWFEEHLKTINEVLVFVIIRLCYLARLLISGTSFQLIFKIQLVHSGSLLVS